MGILPYMWHEVRTLMRVVDPSAHLHSCRVSIVQMPRWVELAWDGEG